MSFVNSFNPFYSFVNNPFGSQLKDSPSKRSSGTLVFTVIVTSHNVKQNPQS